MQLGRIGGLRGYSKARRRITPSILTIVGSTLLVLTVIGLSNRIGVRAAVDDGSASEIESADTTTAGLPGGTRYLLVSSFQCVVAGCQFENSVLRYDGVTGAYLGEHISDIAGPYGMALKAMDETLLVVSRTDNCVYEYDARYGTLIRRFISAGPEGLHSPQNLLVTSDRNILVTSTQTESGINKFNGLLKFDGRTGGFLAPFVDGGPVLSENCAHPRCLRGPNGLALGANGRVYAASGINHQVLEYNEANGAYINFFDSTILNGPIGLLLRPPGTNRAGNLLVTTLYPNTTDPNDDMVIEFDKNTHEVIIENSGVIVPSQYRPGPLAWHPDGSLLIAERMGDLSPYFSDRILRRDAYTGALLSLFITFPSDTHMHFATAMFEVAFGFAGDDANSDGDVDLADYAVYQRCHGAVPTAECLNYFDDNRSAAIGNADFLAFLRNFHGPRRPCSSAAQCADGNPCSADACVNNVCVYSDVTDGTSCADNLFCNGSETCRAGLCRATPPCIDQAHCNETTDRCFVCLTHAECNDNNPCTDDTCTLTACNYSNNTAFCDDGNSCTVSDRCTNGSCGGAPRSCSDGNVCTDDFCDPQFGCFTVHNLNPCNDGSVCTQIDQCLGGTCRGGSPINCSDGNPCTTDTCDRVLGCGHTNNTNPCSDGNLCTVNDLCSGGICRGVAVNCDDSVICTADTCAQGVCSHTPRDSVCDNGLFCDGQEICDPVLDCLPGTPPDCDDGNPCTNDSCSGTSCQHTNNSALCSDSNACTQTDACQGGSCVGGSPVICTALDQCHVPGVCNPATGVCSNPSSPNGTSCDDGDACTTGDTCSGGVCAGGPPTNCDDGNLCTTDGCNPATGCTHTNNAVKCNDGNACTDGDVCSGGACGGTTVSCDDGNPCTNDSCKPAVGCQHVNKTDPCDDGHACTGGDVCAGGVCGGTPIPGCIECDQDNPCDDGNDCTTDSCLGGACVFEDIADPCDDGNACTTGDVCDAGVCVAGPPPDCDDDNPCTDDSCNPSSGCVHVDNVAACNDGNVCTTNDACSAGACVGGTPPVCNDGNVCTTDTCDPLLGCVFTDNNALCDDGNACTTGDTCVAGACVGGPPLDCNDDNSCTDDLCDPLTSCAYADNSAPCDDGNACTTNDVCAGGTCGGAPLNCDDGNVCTDDSCNPASGCEYADNADPCDDNHPCTDGDVCAGGVCAGTPIPDCIECGFSSPCDDGNGCTDDSCRDGVCVFDDNTAPCDDGNACTSNDTCAAGACVGGPPPNCDDGNVCTGDSCNPAVGCEHADNANPCDDGNACTTGDTCSKGLCLGGPPPECDDGNGCTNDSCDPGPGCIHTNNTTQCNDGNGCTTNDACSGGKCVGGPAPNCDDGNVCTDDSCDPVKGCFHVHNGNPCDDGNACTTLDSCSGGVCVGGPLPDCDDGDDCTDDFCDSLIGCDHADNTAPCDDGNACTSNDTCAGGVCGGAALNCDDGNVCTDDSCNPAVGCEHTDNAEPCDDNHPCTDGDVCAGGVCAGTPIPDCIECTGAQGMAAGTLNECDDANGCTDDSCQGGVCVFDDNAAPCDDGNACTGNDTCAAGACVGGPAPNCDDANVCTDDSCNPATGCEHVNNVSACTDGNACTTNDVCTEGACVGGPPLICDDGNVCTTDTCSPATGCTFTNNNDPCDDDDECTTNDVCSGGTCVGGPPPNCNDGNVCTDDSCDSGLGCQNVNNTASCDDGNACTTNDACSGGACVGGPAPNCDDANFCTDDSCNPATGCQHVNNTLVCDDGKFCTQSDICTDGQCVGVVRSCDDLNVCTDDSCDLVNDLCQNVNNAAPCEDGNACTENDVCAGGSCTSGSPLDCDDADVCTDDSCNPATGCVNNPIEGCPH